MSFSAFFIGVLIILVGVAGLKFYRVIADNMGSGVSNYERLKLYFLITCLVGFVVMLNLHTVLLRAFVNLFI